MSQKNKAQRSHMAAANSKRNMPGGQGKERTHGFVICDFEQRADSDVYKLKDLTCNWSYCFKINFVSESPKDIDFPAIKVIDYFSNIYYEEKFKPLIKNGMENLFACTYRPRVWFLVLKLLLI